MMRSIQDNTQIIGVIIILLMSVALALVVYYWQKEFKSARPTHLQKIDSRLPEMKSVPKDPWFWYGIKFGFGFGFGLFLWGIIATILGFIFWSAILAALLRSVTGIH